METSGLYRVETNGSHHLSAWHLTCTFLKDRAAFLPPQSTIGQDTLYAIPSVEKWVVVLNKETDTWGAFGYDAKKDVLRTEVKVITRPDVIDVFTINFEGKEKNKTSLMIGWDNKEVHMPISW